MTFSVRALSRAEVRQLDIQAATQVGLPALLLMENAGRGAASWLAELTGTISSSAGGRPTTLCLATGPIDLPLNLPLPRVIILCGPGNNGGDGAVVARHLDAWGFPVRVIWFNPNNERSGDVSVQWDILNRSGIQQCDWFDTTRTRCDVGRMELSASLSQADWLVDGIFGTGLSRPVQDPFKSIIESMNESGRPIFALDLPSGLDADTGQPLGMAVRARATATFVAAKKGFEAAGASEYTGNIAVIDIGLPRCLLAPYLVQTQP
jgi:NAD(P)H-hydrate epimerase